MIFIHPYSIKSLLLAIAFVFLLFPATAFSQAIVNDECSGAILLTVNTDGTCSSTTTGTQELATQSMSPCTFTGYAAKDVWFKFVATGATQRITVTPLAYRDKIFEVFAGTCGNLTSLVCVNSGGLDEQDMVLLNNLTMGATYYIRVFDRYANTDQSGFKICVSNATTLISNDECSGASNIAVTGSVMFQGPFSTQGATQSKAGCLGVAEDDIWFKFTATGTRHLIWISMANDKLNPIVEVFEGSCTSLTSKGCYSTSTINPSTMDVDLLNLTPGQTYYYRVYGKADNSVRTEIRTSVVTMPPPPSNDECSGAILLNTNSDETCSIKVIGTQEFATQSQAPCIVTGYEAKDVWYKFIATGATQRITVKPLAYRDKIFEVFSGTCGSLTSTACVNSGGLDEQDMVLLNNLSVGTMYYIRVFDKYANTDQSGFELCVSNAASLIPNDECTGAIPVTITGTVKFQGPFSTQGATQSLPGCFGTAEDDIWFKFTATHTRHKIWLSNTNDQLNPVLEFFRGSCSALVSKGCFYTNAVNPANLQADLLNLTPGETYYYRIYGKTATSVRTQIHTSIIPMEEPPAYDECLGAILLTTNTDGSCTNTTIGSQEFATQSRASCISTGYEARDLWFKFVATASTERITVKPLEYMDHIFEVFFGSCGNLTSLACVNTGGSNEQDMALISNLTVGATYYVRVYDKYGNFAANGFSICVSDVGNLISNDECSGAINVAVTSTVNFQGPYNTLGATQSRPGCFGTAEDDIWFKFTATGTRHKIWLSMANDQLNPVLEVFEGGCSALTSKACSYTSEINPANLEVDLLNLTPGQTYYYRVYGKSATSVRTEIRTSVVAIAAPTTVSILFSSSNNVCAGTNLKFTSTIGSIAGTNPIYQWKVNGVPVGTNAAVFESSTLKNGDIVTLEYTMTDGGGQVVTPSNALVVSIIPLPNKPVISLSGNQLTSSAPTGNQWFKDGVLILGATQQIFAVALSGQYHVQVTQNGCSISSDLYNFVATRIIEPSFWNNEVQLYPNPVQNKLFITNKAHRMLVIRIIDPLGKVVQQKTSYAALIQLSTQGLAAGSYVLSVTDAPKHETLTTIILKL